MENTIMSIRPFIGAKDFHLSRNFYSDLGFTETILTNSMSVFKKENTAFYLQDAYVKDWIDNSMIFLEVKNADVYWEQLLTLNLISKYKDIKLVPVKAYAWGKECFIHDPSGILWHVGEFF